MVSVLQSASQRRSSFRRLPGFTFQEEVRMKLRFFAALAVLLISVCAFGQGTTGNLVGTVTLGGNPLPGATVTISSPALQGTRTAISDQNGSFNFGALPPGEYTVRFDMESMQTVTKTTRVSLASTSRAD